METRESLLSELVPALRFGGRDLGAYYDTVGERIDEIDDELHAFVDGTVRSASIDRQIERLEERRATTTVPPPLFGVPVGVKDVFRADGLPTRAGASLPAEALAGPESPLVSELRDLGAVVVGKTVTTTFTHLPTGETRNPHALDHTPGGSSSGSAAAVAAGLCPLAVGSETTGSVIRPAAYCGVVGFRPSRGRLPTAGALSLSPTLDTPGLFTQDTAGMARAAPHLVENWTAAPEPAPTPTVGVPDGEYLTQAAKAGIERFERQIAALASAGYDIERVAVFEDIERTNRHHEELLAAEAASEHAQWYTEYRAKYPPEMVDLIERGETVDVETLGEARRHTGQTRAAIDAVFERADLDLLVAPPAPDTAPAGLADDGDPVMTLPWAHAGVPVVALPVGRSADGLPVGISCIGRYGRDEPLIAHARAVERVLRQGS